ncbi:hypothetical protein KG088_09730 [Halomonas sp. TRM85114]|uniref:hypothetical protein n=1 Tax=Halomonas jincaotanensis TaxID=2810616 RepID=UPI001BD29CAF|nr:hypothetical protein [Halomonas jincaotanensis]MBS9403908.1 hypothetical protein [Halomonas jincaotanensis]
MTLTTVAAMTSTGMILLAARWQTIEVWAYGRARRPWSVWAMAGLLLVLWGLALRDFAMRPEGTRSWAGWCLVVGIPALWAIKSMALVFNPRGRAAVSSISGDRAWRRIGLARLPIAIILAALTLLA